MKKNSGKWKIKFRLKMRLDPLIHPQDAKAAFDAKARALLRKCRNGHEAFKVMQDMLGNMFLATLVRSPKLSDDQAATLQELWNANPEFYKSFRSSMRKGRAKYWDDRDIFLLRNATVVRTKEAGNLPGLRYWSTKAAHKLSEAAGHKPGKFEHWASGYDKRLLRLGIIRHTGKQKVIDFDPATNKLTYQE